jgi:hypothetical protein
MRRWDAELADGYHGNSLGVVLQFTFICMPNG